ncbi:MAG: GNAT family N-acetyltransferase, partial [Candidatus Hydrogenedentes bacterium]|nr:GNAT family N-acetyltransferase [Candidatus Hydrogenedentota bacterium]
MTKQDSPFEETIEETPGGGILLHSARLVLRPCRAADSEFLHHLWTRPEVRQYLWDGRVIERSVVEALVAESRQTFQRRGFGLWLVHLRDEGMDIGFCFLKEKDEAGQAELLYGLLPEYWGKGLAFEAAQRAVRH